MSIYLLCSRILTFGGTNFESWSRFGLGRLYLLLLFLNSLTASEDAPDFGLGFLLLERLHVNSLFVLVTGARSGRKGK